MPACPKPGVPVVGLRQQASGRGMDEADPRGQLPLRAVQVGGPPGEEMSTWPSQGESSAMNLRRMLTGRPPLSPPKNARPPAGRFPRARSEYRPPHRSFPAVAPPAVTDIDRFDLNRLIVRDTAPYARARILHPPPSEYTARSRVRHRLQTLAAVGHHTAREITS